MEEWERCERTENRKRCEYRGTIRRLRRKRINDLDITQNAIRNTAIRKKIKKKTL